MCEEALDFLKTWRNAANDPPPFCFPSPCLPPNTNVYLRLLPQPPSPRPWGTTASVQAKS